MFDSYITNAVANMVSTSDMVETLANRQAEIDSYVTRTIANILNTSGVAEILASQEARWTRY
jgi:hypothetical protein